MSPFGVTSFVFLLQMTSSLRLVIPSCVSSRPSCVQIPDHGGLVASEAASVDVGQDAVRYPPTVLMPSPAILLQALPLVPGLPVHQQCSEVEDVEVG